MLETEAVLETYSKMLSAGLPAVVLTELPAVRSLRPALVVEGSL
jgi:hypothetical protein